MIIPDLAQNPEPVVQALERRDFCRARELTERALANAPDFAGLHVLYSLVLRLSGDSDAAVKAADRAIALDPEYALGYFMKAHAYLSFGKLLEADEAATKAIALDPNALGTLKLWCQIAVERGDNAAFTERLSSFMAQDTQNPDAHVLLAGQMLRLADFDASEAAARHALAIDPECWEAHLILSHVLLQRDQPKDALNAAETALRYQPSNEVAKSTLKKAKQLCKTNAQLDKLAGFVCYFGTRGALIGFVLLFVVFSAVAILFDLSMDDSELKILKVIPILSFAFIFIGIEHHLKSTKPDPAEFYIDPNY